MRDYDKTILEHYKNEAIKNSDSPDATMADGRTRELETELISLFYKAAIECLIESGRSAESIVVADFGCGNGYTLGVLHQLDRRPKLIGYEYSPDLRKISEQRFDGKPVQIRPVDIRQSQTIGHEKIDIALCQRVIINLLDPEDQRVARDNIIRTVSPGGSLLFLECFSSGLSALNEARAEFDLPAISPAYHNLYLDDDFFDVADIKKWANSSALIHKNFLSTHYYVTRVLHPLALGSRSFQRNSPFTSFMSQALGQNIGDFSPIKACVFSKIG